jgi:hypothetical protein
MNRLSGTDALTIRLEQANGTIIEQGTVAAASIPTTTNTYQGNDSWVTLTFTSNHTLTVGQSYNLVLSTASASNYSTVVISDATSVFGPTTGFSDGHAQTTTNGSSWSNVYGDDDWMFYFSVTSSRKLKGSVP